MNRSHGTCKESDHSPFFRRLSFSSPSLLLSRTSTSYRLALSCIVVMKWSYLASLFLLLAVYVVQMLDDLKKHRRASLEPLCTWILDHRMDAG